MDALTNFLHMGGYASYVWSSYAIALIALVWSVWSPLKEKKHLEKRIRRVIENEQSS